MTQFDLKPDYETTKRRYDAFWNCDVADRPPVNISFGAPVRTPVPRKEYANYRDMWMDVDFRAEKYAIEMGNRVYYADSLPVVFPNMGPEIFSAWCGCGYEFGADTTWTVPCIEDWDRDEPKAVLDFNNEYFKAQDRLTRNLLELGKGKFITGLTDFHPGGDHIAALRDPQNLALDLIENPERVKRKIESSYVEFRKAYEYFYDLHKSYDLPISTWLPLISDGKYFVVSIDFSCMISSAMFREFFLPGIIDECRYYEHCIYHVDGPGALHHLDDLLAIKELNAVQWVPGAGHEGYAKWIPVYQKIQKARKGIDMMCDISELDLIFETLRPEGIWFSSITGVRDRQTADEVLRRIENWK